jgi:hypothetical protein
MLSIAYTTRCHGQNTCRVGFLMGRAIWRVGSGAIVEEFRYLYLAIVKS